jgi:magnesium transporter
LVCFTAGRLRANVGRMTRYHFRNGHRPVVLDANTALPDDGFVWIDFVREQAADWPCWIEPLVGAVIDPQHVDDSRNPTHPSFFDGTADYDMLVFEGLGPQTDPFPIHTRVVTFFMFERMLVTVRSADSISVVQIAERLLDGRQKAPGTPLRLAYLMVDAMVDRYLQIREPMNRQLTQMQDALLDAGDAMKDWRQLLVGRREARRLEALSEDQLEALEAWHRNSRFDWDQADEVRYRDLIEHVGRVLAHARDQERDIEAAVQLHFAATAHRTNRVMQALTVLAAIFFPLTFIVGIYGMNFEHMPELGWRYGYFTVLGLLALIAGGLVLWFRRKRLL